MRRCAASTSAMRCATRLSLHHQSLLRGHDRLKAFELHPTDMRSLAGNMAQLEVKRQVAILLEDGFEGVKKFLPPPSRRALLLCDPSYELKTDYGRVLDMVADSLKRSPTGTYAVWYPIIPRPEAHDLPKRLKTMATKASKSCCTPRQEQQDLRARRSACQRHVQPALQPERSAQAGHAATGQAGPGWQCRFHSGVGWLRASRTTMDNGCSPFHTSSEMPAALRRSKRKSMACSVVSVLKDSQANWPCRRPASRRKVVRSDQRFSSLSVMLGAPDVWKMPRPWKPMLPSLHWVALRRGIERRDIRPRPLPAATAPPAMPRPSMPSSCAAALLRSMMRPGAKGPRSLMRTTTLLPVTELRTQLRAYQRQRLVRRRQRPWCQSARRWRSCGHGTCRRTRSASPD